MHSGWIVFCGSIFDLAGGKGVSVRKPAFILLFLLLTLGCVSTHAQAVDGSKKTPEPLPSVLVAGFRAYLEKGPEDAVRAWIKGSGTDDSKDALSQANNLRQVQDFYGSYRSFDVYKTRMLTSRVEAFYLVMNYDKGPLFAKFFFYKTEQGWVLVNFNFNTKEEAIFPTSVETN